MSLTAFTLAGIAAAHLGHDPADGLSGWGLVGFVFSYAPAFVMRLIFQHSASPTVRTAARLFIVAVFAASLLATATAVVLLATGHAGRPTGLPTVFTVLACLAQGGTVVWLAKYSRI